MRCTTLRTHTLGKNQTRMADDADESTTRGELSFERAEFENQEQPKLSCGYCKRPLSVQYWQIAKRPACAECRSVVERELEAGKSPARFFGALQYGVPAAIAGCLGWIVFNALTHIQSGFVAIGVGFLVGKAVRKGARGLGGPRYQVLAVFLTYSAIALASLPDIFQAIRHSQPAGADGSLELGFRGWAFLIGLAYESPFLGGAQNIIGLFIIAIGLYEAWKLTRAMPLNVLGPFPIATDPPAELPASPDATV
jgi:hypothetical protein